MMKPYLFLFCYVFFCSYLHAQNKTEKSPKVNLNCNLSGTDKKLIKTDISSNSKVFHKKQILFLIEYYKENQKNSWPNKCPSHCSAVNKYKVIGAHQPVKTNKNTCPNTQKNKESYSLSKNFSFKGLDADSLVQAHLDLKNWMLSIFVYPYILSSVNKKPQEFIDHKLEKACPSCSFNFDYSYSYIKNNNLEFNIKATCTDKKTILSKVKNKLYLENQWKCIKKEEKKQDNKPEIKLNPKTKSENKPKNKLDKPQ